MKLVYWTQVNSLQHPTPSRVSSHLFFCRVELRQKPSKQSLKSNRVHVSTVTSENLLPPVVQSSCVSAVNTNAQWRIMGCQMCFILKCSLIVRPPLICRPVASSVSSEIQISQIPLRSHHLQPGTHAAPRLSVPPWAWHQKKMAAMCDSVYGFIRRPVLTFLKSESLLVIHVWQQKAIRFQRT